MATAPVRRPQHGDLRSRNSDHFERPVVILVGFGHPAAISSVMEAYMFLVDWPPSRRASGHDFAIKACQAALRDEIEAETVRGIFVGLAEKYNILAPDFGAFAAAYTEGRRGRA
ncbi:DUF982 domain-containing protein [Bosea sp. CS1GBMeth4]|uniref:DUF982 domain-containing protein n=1 Tax=Bosea sp. CS1GBMeth4 TaxID=1892849 RepID=UPI0016470CDF|nr:DUF982 domain-containing protein [Bosea sp. CS1GBMeth4]